MTPAEIIDAVVKVGGLIFSWPVVVLILLLFFRKPIGTYIPQLFQRLRKMEVGSNKFEFTEPVTTETPVGATNVSNTPLREQEVFIDGFQCSYANRQYHFQISWPASHWSPDTSIQTELSGKIPNSEFPILIRRDEAVGGFTPNVNVMIQWVGVMTIRGYMELSQKQAVEHKWIIFSSQTDETTGAGLLVFLNTDNEQKVYQIARVAVANGMAYVVTASDFPVDNQLSETIRGELVSILNSFRLIV